MESSIRNLIRPNILISEPYSSARDEFQGEAFIFLDANESPFGQTNRYPDPYQRALKKMISTTKQISESQIFLGNGSDEIIDLLIRIFCVPGKDCIASLYPTYGMYEISAQINDVKTHKIFLNADFQMDKDQVIKLLNNFQPKILFICSPNNPTGNCINDIGYILDNYSGILVIDEAYIDFSNQESFTKRLCSYPRLIILQTMSKAWGAASLRIGMAFSHPDLINILNKIKPPYNIGQINQEMACSILNNYDEVSTNIASLKAQRYRLAELLQSFKYVQKVFPSEANFILVKVIEPDRIYKFLLSRGIVVRNRSKIIEGCLRITIGTEDENTNLINALKELNYE